jgi:ferredoxin
VHTGVPQGNAGPEDGKAVVRGTESLGCDHCAAACPVDAIRVAAVDPPVLFQHFHADTRWLPHGRFDTATLVNLMGSRRSCRNFSGRPVDRAMLEDLVKVGITAPSGSNCQPWTFTILPDRKAIDRLGSPGGCFLQEPTAWPKTDGCAPG